MPKRVDHAARKRELAEAAIEAIDGAGLDGVRLVDVAKAAKLTTGAVIHYLPSKDAVLSAALAEVVARLLKRLDTAGEESVVDLALDYLPQNEVGWRETRVWLQFWGRALSNPALREQHRQHYADIVAAVRKGFPPELTEAEAVAAADAIIAAVDGLSIRIAMEPELWSKPRRRATLEVLLAAFLEPENTQ